MAVAMNPIVPIDGAYLDELVISTLKSADYSVALETVRQAWPRLAIADGDRVRRLLDAVPSHEWQRDPWLITAYAASYRPSGSQGGSAAIPYFTAALAAETDATPPHVSVATRMHYAAALRSLGRFDDAVARCREATALLDADDTLPLDERVGLHARLALQLGLAKLHLGELDESRTGLRLAFGLAAQLHEVERVKVHAALALLEFLLGDYLASGKLADQAIEQARNSGVFESSFAAPALIVRLLLASDRGELEHAERLAPLVPEASANSEWEPFGHYAIATVSMLRSRHVESLESLRSAVQVFRSWQPPGIVQSLTESLRASILMMLGETHTAWDILGSMRSDHNHASCPARSVAQLRLASGDAAGALAALRRCDELGDAHAARPLVDVMAVQAAANFALGNHAAADVACDRALLLASRLGLPEAFRLVERSIVEPLLDRAETRGQPTGVTYLLGDDRGGSAVRVAAPIQRLSDRERVIATFLYRDLSPSEIAETLYISVNTVKSHVRSIYRKLGVRSRSDAIKRMRELGLHINFTTT